MLALALVLASVTDKLATWVTHVIGDLGLPGIFLLTAPESACIPIPSEVTLLFAGFNVSEGKFSLIAAVLVALAGEMTGATIAYAVGRFGLDELFARYPVFHVNREQLDRAQGWFERYGVWTVFIGRLLPVVRSFISLPAGIARMPYPRFLAATVAGSLPWILALTLGGRAAGDNWDRWKDRLHYVDYAVVAAIAAGILWLALRWWRGRRARVATDAA